MDANCLLHLGEGHGGHVLALAPGLHADHGLLDLDVRVKLNHAVRVIRKLRRLVPFEVGVEQELVEDEPVQVLDHLVRHVGCDLVLGIGHEGVLWVDALGIL